MCNKIYAKLPDAERKKRQAESKLKFKDIYEKTLMVLGASQTDVPCSGGFQKCWSELLGIWSKYASKIGCNVIYAALHHIAWNRYPNPNMPKTVLDLLCLVEQAVLDEGYAYEVWSQSYFFDRALDEVKDTASVFSADCYCQSVWFGRYIYSRVYSQVCLKSRTLCSPIQGMRLADFRMFKTLDEARENVRVFEDTIKRLLPSAATWTRSAWTDEDGILQEIYLVHGINYTKNYQAFDDLVDVFKLVLNGQTYDRSLMLLSQFPVSMVACLWPKDTKENLERFFIRVCKRTSKQMKANPTTGSVFRHDVLEKSWVYQQFSNGTWTQSTAVKKQMFEYMLGV